MASEEVKKTAPDALIRDPNPDGSGVYNGGVIELSDCTGMEIRLAAPPRRVVSLVPSTTETAYALDAARQLVGVTRYCVRPPEARRRAGVVGGTKSPRIALIRELEPDLVLANLEENRKEDVAAIRRFASVYVAFPQDVGSAIEEIGRLGRLLGREEQGRELSKDLTGALTDLRTGTRGRPRFRFCYLIWRNPYMAAGKGTFIDALFAEAGGVNAMPAEAGRYPRVTVHDIESVHPDVVLLSSEPFPFAPPHIEELLRQMAVPRIFEGRVLLVDGQLLSWHGVRLLEGIPYVLDLAGRIRHHCAPATP